LPRSAINAFMPLCLISVSVIITYSPKWDAELSCRGASADKLGLVKINVKADKFQISSLSPGQLERFIRLKLFL